jgi:hypothetical protein
MSEPHRHHFIPTFYLRNWHGPDEKLVEYTIKHGKLIPKPVSADATGFQRDLYEFPELPSPLSQFLEKEFFNYADRTALDALKMLLDGLPKHLWSSEMLSAWVRFLVGVHTRHFDTIPEIRDAAKALWAASGAQSQRIYEDIRRAGRPAHIRRMDCHPRPANTAQSDGRPDGRAMDNRDVGQHITQMQWEVIEITGTPRRFLTSDRPLGMYLIKEPTGSITLPISPTKLFAAVNNTKYLNAGSAQKFASMLPYRARLIHVRWSGRRAGSRSAI